MTVSVVDRLVDAINAHDIEALTACFAPTYSVVWPAHPARSFTGTDNVRRTWEGIFQAHPEITATIATQVRNGDEIWGEWEFTSEDLNAPQFWQRGVIVAVVDGDVIAQSRFYMEPVEATDG